VGVFGRQIVGRLVIVLAVAIAALAMATSAASAANELPRQWDPRKVAVNREAGNTFLLRPGQILAGPGDAPDVQRVLTGWRQSEQRPFGVTVFTRAPQNLADPAREVLDALARIRKATANRPQGPARVGPNHVFVGEAAATNFYGEPRLQGGPGSSVRQAALPAALPMRTRDRGDGQGVRIAVLDTGMFEHEWLKGVQRGPDSDDVWDVERDGYGDAEAGHGTFIAGLILQVAPAASVYAVKVLDSHGVGDDLSVAAAMEQLPPDIDVVNLSLGGYTDRDAAPLALATALRAMGERRAVVAAAGNQGASRPFWPAAFDKQVLAIGAVEQREGKWTRAAYSNHGPWVDATARGSNLQSTFTREKTMVAQGLTTNPTTDPTIAFGGWASWDGTSFATPIVAALLARTMSRDGLVSAAEAQSHLLATSPPAQQPDFPRAVLLDELEGMPEPSMEVK
jgi:subtilisin family serine protease